MHSKRAPYSKLETLTPKLADHLLETLTHGPLNIDQVSFLATELRENRWRKFPGAIMIADAERVLVDGAHRCGACSLTGISFPVYIWHNVPADTNPDLGIRGHSLAEAMKLNKNIVSAARQLAAACCKHHPVKMSMGSTLIVLDEFQGDIERVTKAMAGFRAGKHAWVVGALALACGADPGTIPFIEAFGSGEGLHRGDPAKAARQWLTNNEPSGHDHNHGAAVETLLIAAYHAAMGEQITVLRRSDQGLNYFLGRKAGFVKALRSALTLLLPRPRTQPVVRA
jgi:hypothetical protein